MTSKQTINGTVLTDEDLLVRFRSGDAAAFDLLLDRNRRAVFAWFVSVAGSREDAEDLFQNLWLKIIKNKDRFEGGSFRCWMWRIARNLSNNYIARKRAWVSLDEPVGGDDDSRAAVVDTIESEEMIPTQLLERSEDKARLRKVMAELPHVFREVICLRLDGNKISDIAEIIGISTEAANSRLRRAVVALRDGFMKEA